jgi:hypothetical protein
MVGILAVVSNREITFRDHLNIRARQTPDVVECGAEKTVTDRTTSWFPGLLRLPKGQRSLMKFPGRRLQAGEETRGMTTEEKS